MLACVGSLSALVRGWVLRLTACLAIAVNRARASNGCSLDVLEVDDLPLVVPVIEVCRYRELAIESEFAPSTASERQLTVNMVRRTTGNDNVAAWASFDSGLDRRSIVHGGRAARCGCARRCSLIQGDMVGNWLSNCVVNEACSSECLKQ